MELDSILYFEFDKKDDHRLLFNTSLIGAPYENFEEAIMDWFDGEAYTYAETTYKQSAIKRKISRNKTWQ